MKLTKDQVTMLNWIKHTMSFERWYPMKSDKAYDTIIELFELDKLDNDTLSCELNENENYIRKIEFNFKKKINNITYNQNYDKTKDS